MQCSFTVYIAKCQAKVLYLLIGITALCTVVLPYISTVCTQTLLCVCTCYTVYIAIINDVSSCTVSWHSSLSIIWSMEIRKAPLFMFLLNNYSVLVFPSDLLILYHQPSKISCHYHSQCPTCIKNNTVTCPDMFKVFMSIPLTNLCIKPVDLKYIPYGLQNHPQFLWYCDISQIWWSEPTKIEYGMIYEGGDRSIYEGEDRSINEVGI